jgi:RNA polymerase sigma-70 factor (ECF subfamily)
LQVGVDDPGARFVRTGTQTATDESVVAAVAAGDQDAFRELWRRFAPTVHGFAVRRLGDRAAAEDLVQDVFITAWRSAPSYDPDRAPVGAWLMTIARNRLIDRLRRASVRPQLAAVDPGDEPELAGATSADSGFETALTDRITMRAALDQLPEGLRSLVELAFFEGLSHSQIAERTGIALGTVKSRMTAALRQLAAVVER